MSVPKLIEEFYPSIPSNFNYRHLGPFHYGGAVYVVWQEVNTPFDLIVVKNADPITTDAWTEQVNLTNPGQYSNFRVSVWREGSDLHIVHGDTSKDLSYSVFSMASDTLTTTDELIIAAVYDPLGSCIIRSDGDLVVTYGQQEKVHGTNYTRRMCAYNDGTWTTEVSLDAGGETNYGNLTSGLFAGTSGRVSGIWSTTSTLLTITSAYGFNLQATYWGYHNKDHDNTTGDTMYFHYESGDTPTDLQVGTYTSADTMPSAPTWEDVNTTFGRRNSTGGMTFFDPVSGDLWLLYENLQVAEEHYLYIVKKTGGTWGAPIEIRGTFEDAYTDTAQHVNWDLNHIMGVEAWADGADTIVGYLVGDNLNDGPVYDQVTISAAGAEPVFHRRQLTTVRM